MYKLNCTPNYSSEISNFRILRQKFYILSCLLEYLLITRRQRCTNKFKKRNGKICRNNCCYYWGFRWHWTRTCSRTIEIKRSKGSHRVRFPARILYVAFERSTNFDLQVIGLARREIDIRHENFVALKCDVGNAGQVKAAFKNIKEQFPNIPISILVNNAGHAKVRYEGDQN